jgi:hypothetical protein
MLEETIDNSAQNGDFEAMPSLNHSYICLQITKQLLLTIPSPSR